MYNTARTLVELVDSRQLFTLAQLIRVGGLEETLSNAGDYTLFAPTEAALYSKLFGQEMIKALFSSASLLAIIL